MSIPWFFERLGLEPTREIKSIKRAYAQALKSIDQQHDREGFETLRRAYELATAWAKREEEEDEEDDDVEAAHDTGSDDREEDSAHDSDGSDDANDADRIDDHGQTDSADLGDRTADNAALTHGLADELAGILGVPPSSILVQLGQPQPDDPLKDDPAFGADAQVADPTPSPAQQAAEHLRQEQAESRAALKTWIARLLSPQGEQVDRLLAQALADPRMMHLDSQIELERQIAEAMHETPAGQIDLFDAASARFGWSERNARPQARASTAAWISRVINQTLQWEGQDLAIIAARNNTLKVATRTQKPSQAQAYEYWPLLRSLHQQFPDWLALQLPADSLDRWEQAHANISAGWLRIKKWKNKFAGSTSRVLGTLMLISFLFALGVPLIKSAVRGFTTDTDTTAQQQAAASKPGAPAVPEPVLAYEFTGAITKDSCDDAHEFIHESNWLEVDDRDASGLLTTRVFLCQDKGLWPEKDDPLVQCLRRARLSALSGATPETLSTCATPAAPAGK